MSPTIRNDPDRPSGGHALLEGPGLAEVGALTVENVSSGLFLSAGGRWAKLPHPFPVEAVGQALRLGPTIVDHVPEELLVALRSSDGRDLGRLFWQDVMPSRGRIVAAPPAAAPSPTPAAPAVDTTAPVSVPDAPDVPSASEAQPAPPPATTAVDDSQPVLIRPTRRVVSRAALAALSLILLLAAGGAWTLLRPRAPEPIASPPPRDLARRCSDDFGSKVAAARAGSDDDRVRMAETALASGCGSQALSSLDGVDWEMNESAAWHLARFYDPNETDPIVRDAGSRHPDWAATFYAHWAPRVPREAAALKQLCTTDAATLDANTQLKRACGR